MIFKIYLIEEQLFQIFKILGHNTPVAINKDAHRVRAIVGDVFEVLYKSYLKDNEPIEYQL